MIDWIAAWICTNPQCPGVYTENPKSQRCSKCATPTRTYPVVVCVIECEFPPKPNV